MVQFHARYFDGATAKDRKAMVSVLPAGLAISIADGDRRELWLFTALRAVSPASAGHPLRLANDKVPGARLTVSNTMLIEDLLRLSPQLRGGLNLRRIAQLGGIAAASLAAVALVIYLLFSFAPQKLAFLVPDAWRSRLGDQVEKSFVSGARECTAPAGRAALDRLTERLRDGNPDLVRFGLRVYDIPVTNAFALPGGRIVIFRQLIERAEAPDEVTGVLAHEIGHVSYRHAEAQLIRSVGIQLLLSMATGGGSGGDTMGSFAGLLALLSYSRAAEREADSFGRTLLVNADIDPLGLKRFFETIAREQGEPLKGAFGKMGNMMSTHPVTQDRIDAITPLNHPARPVMTDSDWQALRSICN